MASKITHSFLWDLTGRIGNQIMSFIIGIVLARLLSPAEFGLIGMAMVFIGVSEIFTNLGLSSALIQRKDPTEAHYSSSFYLNLVSSIFLAVLFVFFAPLIAGFFKSPEITNIIRVLAISLIISGFTVVQQARLTKQMRFNVLTKAKLTSSLISGITGILLAWKGFGVWSLVIQTILGRFLLSLYFWIVTDWKPKLMFRWNAIRELWSYSFNLFLSGILDTFYNQLDSIIIARVFSATDLGLYSRAKSLNRFVIKYSSESLGSVTFPAMTAMKDDRQKMIEFGLKAETLIAFVSFGLLGWLYVAAEPLILGLLGQKWEAAIPIFKILCLSGFAYPISAATLSMLKAAGHSKSFLKVEIWKKVIGLLGLAIGFMFGLQGFLISLIISGAIAVWLNMYYTGKALDITVAHQLKPLLIYPVIAIISTLVILFLPVLPQANLLRFAVITFVFAGLYLALNFVLHTSGLHSFYNQSKTLFPGKTK